MAAIGHDPYVHERINVECVQILKVSEGTYSLNVDEEELSVLNNALNEICNGIHIAEFETRVVATMLFAQAVAGGGT